MVNLNSSSGSTATFDWTASPSDTTAQLYYGPTTSYGSTLSGTASGASGSLHLSGLAGYETFYYKAVVSSDITGETCYTDAGATGSFVPYYGHTLTMEFVVYNDSGTITVGDGPAIPSGSELTLYSPSSLTVSFDQSAASEGLGQSLQSWYTDAGTVTYPMEYTATLNVFSGDSSGVTSVALAQPLQPWGGYSESGAGIMSASATIVLPSSVAYFPGISNGVSSTDAVGFWVGIGGVNGNARLWQAGVLIQATSSSTSILGFFEDVPYGAAQLSSSAGSIFYHNASAIDCSETTGPSTLNLHLGDEVAISVSYWNYTGLPGLAPGNVGNFSIDDLTSGGEWYGIEMCLPFSPDQTTADFDEEAPVQYDANTDTLATAVVPSLGADQSTLFEGMTTSLSSGFSVEAPVLAMSSCSYFLDGSGYFMEQTIDPANLVPSSLGSAEFDVDFAAPVTQGPPSACNQG